MAITQRMSVHASGGVTPRFSLPAQHSPMVSHTPNCGFSVSKVNFYVNSEVSESLELPR
jgi:hypothetical protein